MSDFFADLERQLVDATPRRAQRIRRHRTRRAAALCAVLLAVVAGGAGLASAVGGSDAGSSSGGGPAATAPAITQQTIPAAPGATPLPGTYTVAVLNGTTVPGLARGVANRLQNSKFKLGNVTNAASQERSTTRVEYRPGHRAEADAVARAIDVGSDALQRVSPGSEAIAGAQATVVVLVGSDQSTSPQTQDAPTHR